VAVTGQTFTLTKSDDISGILKGSNSTTSTTGDDTFTSVNTAAESTYTSGDVLVGGDGNDTLNITVDNVALGAATSVSGFEKINVTAVGTGVVDASSYNADKVVMSGSTLTVKNTQSVNGTSFTVSNLGTGGTVVADAGITGTLSVTTSAATTQSLTIAANKAGTQTVVLTQSGAADVASISAAGKVGLTATNIETLNFSGNGEAVTYTMASALGATANNITGAQSVTLAGTSANFTGATVTDQTTAGVTNIDLTAITATTNLTKATVDLVTLTGDRGAALSLSVKSGQAIKSAVAHTAGDITLSIDNGDTTYTDGTVTLELTKNHGTGIGFAVAAKSATADNITTLNLINDTVAQTALEILATADTALSISGSKAVVLETTSTAKSITHNGSGALTVNYDGTSDVATVTGGSGNDTFAIASGYSSGALTINGGAGVDKISLAASEDFAKISMSNIEVIDLSASGATIVADFLASQLNGKDLIVLGAGSDDSIEINSSNSVDTLSIDLSKLALDANIASITIDGTKITSSFGASQGQTIVGSTAADTYNGSAGADTVTAGAGQDVIIGNDGADQINLTETTDVKDSVKFSLAEATTSYDTITGFKAGTGADVIWIDGALKHGGGTAVGTAGDATQDSLTAAFLEVNVVTLDATAECTITTGSTEVVYEVTGATLTSTDIVNATAVATFLDKVFDFANTTAAGNAQLIFSVSDGTDSYLWYFNAGTSDATIDAGEITLIARVAGVTTGGFASNDFVA